MNTSKTYDFIAHWLYSDTMFPFQITKDPTQSFLHRMSLNLRNEQAKAAAPENSQQPAAEPHSHAQGLNNRNAVPGDCFVTFCYLFLN